MENTKHKLKDFNKVLYLLPAPISEKQSLKDLIDENLLQSIEVFLVENVRTSRRLIRKSFPRFPIDDKQWIVISKTQQDYKALFSDAIKEKKTFGLMSEGGSPAIADPGSDIVLMAHTKGLQVKPLLSPNSIFLALMASGLNGQKFSFLGYFPIKQNERAALVKSLLYNTKNIKEDITYIFIETPYRTQNLFQYLLEILPSKIYLCLAQDICGDQERIISQTVYQWKKCQEKIKNIPTIFLIQKKD